MQKRKLIVLAVLLSVAQLSIAQAISSDSVLGLIKSGMAPAVSRLTSTAITWLGVFAVLQFVITNYGLLKNDGDLQTVIAKSAASLTWVGVCLYIINNGPEFIQGVGDEMMGIVGFDLPSASGVIAQTVKLSGVLAGLAVAASATPFVGNTIGQLLLYIAIGILVVGLLFAFKIFMIQLELGLIAILAPLSFAFLGLSTLKDQGIAPFKSLLSFTYRVIILTVILSAFSEVNNVLVSSLSDVKASDIIANGIGNIIDSILSAVGAYLLLAFLVWKSDGVASSMASGSTSLGNGDVASAAAAGAAAGAVVASAGAAAAGGAAQAPQSMANFMSGLNGGGSIKNVGGMGGGGSPAPFVPPAAPSMSRGAASGGASPSSGAGMPGSGGGSSAGAGGPAKPNGSGSVASGRYGAAPASNVNGVGAPDASQSQQAPQPGDSQTDASTGTGEATDLSQDQTSTMDSAGVHSANTSPESAPDPTAAVSDSSSSGPGISSSQDPTGASATSSTGQNTAQTPDPAGQQAGAMTVSPAPTNTSGKGTSTGVTSPSYGSPQQGGAPASAPTSSATQPSANSAPGSGNTAAIGSSNQMQQTLNQIAQSLANQGTKKPTLKDHLSEANRQVERERDTTHVHINTHNSD